MEKSTQHLFRSARLGFNQPVRMHLLVLAVLFAGGCSLPGIQEIDVAGEQEEQPVSEGSLAEPTRQQAHDEDMEIPPTPTAEESPTSAPLPSVTPGDGLPPSRVEAIQFRQGGTMACVQGEIEAGQPQTYTFEAGAGQTLLAGVSSEDQEVSFEIRGLSDGTVLTLPGEELSSISVTLPSTQTYQLTLNSETDSNYFLSVEIPAVLSVEAGANPLVLEGYLDVLQAFHPDVFTRLRYLVELEEGTVLNVQLTSPALEDLTLALTGVEDGVPYLRHVVKTDAITDFPVPATQGYYLDVYNVSGVSAAYNLEIEAGR